MNVLGFLKTFEEKKNEEACARAKLFIIGDEKSDSGTLYLRSVLCQEIS